MLEERSGDLTRALTRENYDFRTCGYLGCEEVAVCWADLPDGYENWDTGVMPYACASHKAELSSSFGELRFELALPLARCVHCGTGRRDYSSGPDGPYCHFGGCRMDGCDGHETKVKCCDWIGCNSKGVHHRSVSMEYADWMVQLRMTVACDEHRPSLDVFGLARMAVTDDERRLVLASRDALAVNAEVVVPRS